MATEQKVWWKSATVWVNVIPVLIALLTQVEQMLSTGQVLTVVGLLNVAVRVFLTKSAIAKQLV